VLLVGRHPAPNSPVIDHIIPHRGDERLFWDESNLHAVSKAYHDSTKQSEERRGRR
jgi:5-methylcytosine-specific restriction endonuclease McrA